MSWNGLITGAATFLIIGAFHPLVIKLEYYFTKKVWPVFLAGGLLLTAGSLFCPWALGSTLLGVTGFSCLWSIHEIIEQEARVRRGWFPANPARAAGKAPRQGTGLPAPPPAPQEPR